ncbi:MAG: hypothetical protein M1831_002235 [Alyxoria varia]|nr:MAG: hypothetical protein M1831_002235 [Alyxoria varia]
MERTRLNSDNGPDYKEECAEQFAKTAGDWLTWFSAQKLPYDMPLGATDKCPKPEPGSRGDDWEQQLVLVWVPPLTPEGINKHRWPEDIKPSNTPAVTYEQAKQQKDKKKKKKKKSQKQEEDDRKTLVELVASGIRGIDNRQVWGSAFQHKTEPYLFQYRIVTRTKEDDKSLDILWRWKSFAESEVQRLLALASQERGPSRERLMLEKQEEQNRVAEKKARIGGLDRHVEEEETSIRGFEREDETTQSTKRGLIWEWLLQQPGQADLALDEDVRNLLKQQESEQRRQQQQQQSQQEQQQEQQPAQASDVGESMSERMYRDLSAVKDDLARKYSGSLTNPEQEKRLKDDAQAGLAELKRKWSAGGEDDAVTRPESLLELTRQRTTGYLKPEPNDLLVEVDEEDEDEEDPKEGVTPRQALRPNKSAPEL